MPVIIVKILSVAIASVLLISCGNDDGESAATDTQAEVVPTPTPAGEVDNTDLSVKPLVTIPRLLRHPSY